MTCNIYIYIYIYTYIYTYIWQQNPKTDNRAGKNICYSMTDKNLMSLEDIIPTDWKDKNVSGIWTGSL